MCRRYTHSFQIKFCIWLQGVTTHPTVFQGKLPLQIRYELMCLLYVCAYFVCDELHVCDVMCVMCMLCELCACHACIMRECCMYVLCIVSVCIVCSVCVGCEVCVLCALCVLGV